MPARFDLGFEDKGNVVVAAARCLGLLGPQAKGRRHRRL